MLNFLTGLLILLSVEHLSYFTLIHVHHAQLSNMYNYHADCLRTACPLPGLPQLHIFSNLDIYLEFFHLLNLEQLSTYAQFPVY